MPKKQQKGRPSKYTKKIADQICIEIAEGNKKLSKICENTKFPTKRTVLRWLLDEEKYGYFCHQYARAFELRLEGLLDDNLIIDAEDVATYTDAQGNTRMCPTDLNRHKINGDNTKWQASKLNRKKYGKDAEIPPPPVDDPLDKVVFEDLPKAKEG